MRLLSWNVQWCRGMDGRVDPKRIAAEAKRLADPDVFCLQEIARNFPEMAGSAGEDQVEVLRREMPGYQAFFVPAIDLPGRNGRRRFGNLVLSRLPVGRVLRHLLPWPPAPEVMSMPRAAVEVVVEAPFGPLRVTTTHLEYYSDVQRRAQAQRLRNLHDEACQRALHPSHASAAGGPFDATPQTTRSILCGDFNFPPDNPAYGEVQHALASHAPRYRDAWELVHGHHPHTATFCVHSDQYAKTPYCCDFAFVSDDIASRVRAIEVDSQTQVSDHQPVLVEIDDR